MLPGADAIMGFNCTFVSALATFWSITPTAGEEDVFVHYRTVGTTAPQPGRFRRHGGRDFGGGYP